MSIQTHALGRSYLDDAELPELLRLFERYVAVPYADPVGIATIGIGINIDQTNDGNVALVLRYLGVFAASDASEAARRQQGGLPLETSTEKRQRYLSIVSDFRQT